MAKRKTCDCCDGTGVLLNRIECKGKDFNTDRKVKRVRYICDCCVSWGVLEDNDKIEEIYGMYDIE